MTLRFLVLVGLAALITQGAPAQNGIFADFTTSRGNFVCELDYTNSPRAVANFIGLATGARPWVDASTGGIRTNAFYNGVTFHRVIKDFMIQSGSRNGLGTDDAGYVFRDQFSALKHDGAGVLSMANSGPDSNGSQFFITVTNTPWLDGLHTIFGRVVSGYPVVNGISRVATDGNNKPLTNVVIHSVVVRRVGTAAQAFDIHGQRLPTITAEPLHMVQSTNEVQLVYTPALYSENLLCHTADLRQWTNSSLGIDITEPAMNQKVWPTSGNGRFFSLTRVQYGGNTRSPRTVQNRNLTLNFSANGGTLAINFNGTGTGLYNYNGSPGTIVEYAWIQEPYRGKLWPIYFSNLVPMTLQLNFTNVSGGSFSGVAYPNQPNAPFAVNGLFGLAP